MARRIAFYAPLKSPRHPVPSGDRRMARSLIHVLRRAGHHVDLASGFRSFDRDGSPARQERLKALGERLANRLIARYHTLPANQRPEAWITYHAYHKSPDWLGPIVCQALDLPYLLIETSFARKQAGGRWDIGHRATEKAIRAADLILAVTRVDHAGLAPPLARPSALRMLLPFIDHVPFAAASDHRERYRKVIAERFHMNPSIPWLLTVAMMRHDVKLLSYEILSQSLARITDRPWQILVAGGGPALPKVEESLSRLGSERVFMGGILEEAKLMTCYAAADVYAWPAVGEAYGLAMLEAQAAGLPVVAGREGGVSDVVQDGKTGRLTPPRDAEAFARALADLLDHPTKGKTMGQAARTFVRQERNLDYASEQLNDALTCAWHNHKDSRADDDDVSV